MDSAKYIDILKSFFDEMNLILPNGWTLQWDNDLKHKSKDSLCFYIKKQDRIDEMASLKFRFKSYWNIWETLSII